MGNQLPDEAAASRVLRAAQAAAAAAANINDTTAQATQLTGLVQPPLTLEHFEVSPYQADGSTESVESADGRSRKRAAGEESSAASGKKAKQGE